MNKLFLLLGLLLSIDGFSQQGDRVGSGTKDSQREKALTKAAFEAK